MFRIEPAVNRLAHPFRDDRATVETVARSRTLIHRPVTRFRTVFQQLDGLTVEPAGALRAIDQTIEFVRRHRDELHESLLIWQAPSERFADTPSERSPDCDALVKDTYRLLAAEYPQVQNWR